MSEFVVNLLDKPMDDSPTVEKYARYFTIYDPVEWELGSGGGSFVYFDEHGSKWALSITHAAHLGFSLLFNERLAGERQGSEYICVANMAKMNEFCSAGNDILLPRGSFLTPEETWKAVEDFIVTPTEMSTQLNWMLTLKLNWPDM